MGLRPPFQAVALGLAGIALAGTAVVRAQIEGGARGAAPVDSSSNFEVNGIRVDVSAKTADAARLAGWRLAQRKGWALLSQRLAGSAQQLPDGTLDSLSSGIIVEEELIGPTRYIARLGVLFDRERAGSILGVETRVLRSAPMLVLPVLYSGGTGQVFERTSPWQQAWARFRTGGSAIDYVRRVGTGPDPLLLNVGQTGRRGRGWWRTILDQYGASDILMPEARLYRLWPGGPIVGTFSAFHGPDMQRIARFSLRVDDGNALPALLDAGVKRIDEAYQQALRSGILRPDPLLAPPPSPEVETIAEDGPTIVDLLENDTAATPPPVTGGATVQLQFDTPSPGAVTTIEANVRAIPGVQSAITTSLALGGVSVMRVAYDGDPAALRAALEARGWSVSEGGGTLRIRRAGAPAAAPSPVPTPTASPTPAPKGG